VGIQRIDDGLHQLNLQVGGVRKLLLEVVRGLLD
jgi:hypothetical protein